MNCKSTTNEGIDQMLELDPETLKKRIDLGRREMTSIHCLTNDLKTIGRYFIRAAVILGAVALTSLISYHYNHLPSEKPAYRPYFVNIDDLRHPLLTLTDGRQVMLDQIPTGKEIITAGYMIVKTGQYTIAYISLPSSSHGPAVEGSGYDVIHLPYRQSWKIMFPDSSSIQLGAGSTLSYSMSSSKPFRPTEASLRGQAYFDIATSTHRPMTVETPSGSITVLGTRFSLRDYARQDGLRATLISGKIRVNYTKGAAILRPGEEAVIDGAKKRTCMIHQVDTAAALDWCLDYFHFTERNGRQTLQTIVDWYGLKGYIVGEGADSLVDNLGVGEIQKNFPLETLFEMWDSPRRHFSIKGKTLNISK